MADEMTVIESYHILNLQKVLVEVALPCSHWYQELVFLL